MAKPEKNLSAGVSPMIDGILTKRVQTLGSSVDITREQAQELANTGVVEYTSDAPSVSIQIDTNDVGSTDTLALLTDKMIQYTSTASKDTRGGFAGMKFFIRTGSSNAVTRTITEQDMLNGYCSINATINNDGTAAARTLWMNHAALTGVALSYDVNGNATENYTLSTDNKTWFLNGWANARCYKMLNYQIVNRGSVAMYTTSGARGMTFAYLGSAIPVNSTPIALGINGTILRSRASGSMGGNATFYGGGGGTGGGVQLNRFACTTYALSTPWVSTASGSKDRIWAMFAPPNRRLWEASATGQGLTDPGWELESTSGALGALRRGQIKAYLYNTLAPSRDSAVKAGKALRLQTVSIDIALGEEQLIELGNAGFYGISKNTPVPVTVSLTANDSDLEYFANLVGTAQGTNLKQVSVDDFNGSNALKIEIYKDKQQTILLKTININKLYVQSENFNINVGDKAQSEISFLTDNISIVGSGVNITGGFFGAL